jgi:hypothetical protein
MSQTDERTPDEQSKDYVRGMGQRCPVCLELWTIEGEEVTIDAGKAYQAVNCTECGASWTDEYVLTGIANLKLYEEE